MIIIQDKIYINIYVVLGISIFTGRDRASFTIKKVKCTINSYPKLTTPLL